MDMCSTLLRHFKHQPLTDERGILFHCFGGINRSSAALCAWLIFQRDLTTEEAVHSLLVARPSLYPWKFRPHVLGALKTWEKTQASVIKPRISTIMQEACLEEHKKKQRR